MTYLSPEMIAAIGAALIAVGTFIQNYRDRQRAASQSELDRALKRIKDLEHDNDSLHDQIDNLRDENAVLRGVLRENGLQIPHVRQRRRDQRADVE